MLGLAHDRAMSPTCTQQFLLFLLRVELEGEFTGRGKEFQHRELGQGAQCPGRAGDSLSWSTSDIFASSIYFNGWFISGIDSSWLLGRILLHFFSQ